MDRKYDANRTATVQIRSSGLTELRWTRDLYRLMDFGVAIFGSNCAYDLGRNRSSHEFTECCFGQVRSWLMSVSESEGVRAVTPETEVMFRRCMVSEKVTREKMSVRGAWITLLWR